MPSHTPSPAPLVTAPAGPEVAHTTQAAVVLERVAARVQQRLAAEQAASHRLCDGGHAASLILPGTL
ncbi:HaaA family cyclophane-containing RiPP peptide [Streptomyces sp. NPDC047515]|uniref:HaaA family cyclophane-containing RiPP peptide n=1 Tax=Streptomyces sp. NPDC047515 TaxID=3155380 RepID=UPI0033FA28EA